MSINLARAYVKGENDEKALKNYVFWCFFVLHAQSECEHSEQIASLSLRHFVPPPSSDGGFFFGGSKPTALQT